MLEKVSPRLFEQSPVSAGKHWLERERSDLGEVVGATVHQEGEQFGGKGVHIAFLAVFPQLVQGS